MTDRSRDIAGHRFGFLVAASREIKSKNGTWKWRVRCDCGTEEVVFITVLTSGRKTCCLNCFPDRQRQAKLTHGMTKSPEYLSWKAMKARCLNPEASHFDQYGGRGVKIDPKWESSFEAFLSDMGPRPKGTTLDRIDANGDYVPGNCRWATPKEQATNRRNNVTIEYRGEPMTIAEVVEATGLSRSTIRWRLANWGSVERTPTGETKISETVA